MKETAVDSHKPARDETSLRANGEGEGVALPLVIIHSIGERERERTVSAPLTFAFLSFLRSDRPGRNQPRDPMQGAHCEGPAHSPLHGPVMW